MAEHESRAESASLRLELAEERRGQSPTETWEIMGKPRFSYWFGLILGRFLVLLVVSRSVVQCKIAPFRSFVHSMGLVDKPGRFAQEMVSMQNRHEPLGHIRLRN